MRLTKRDVAEIVTLLALFLALVAVAVLFHRNDSSRDLRTTWPESAEFSTLDSGQGRFLLHDTNLDGWRILVDRQTGVQYIVGNTAHTVCPLLDADGSPLLVAEAGE